MTSTSTSDFTINEMIKALGGNRFFAMTGTKPLTKDCSTSNIKLSFKLARNSSGANYFEFIYNAGMDLYEMKFIKVSYKTLERKEVASYENVYGDMVESIFTNVTGLYTRL